MPMHGALVMDYDPEPPEAQAFWRAVERAGMATSLFETDRRLAGYDWYDGLDRVTRITTMIASDGKWSPLDDFPRAGADPTVRRQTAAPGPRRSAWTSPSRPSRGPGPHV